MFDDCINLCRYIIVKTQDSHYRQVALWHLERLTKWKNTGINDWDDPNYNFTEMQ